MPNDSSFFHDPSFQEKLVALVVRDRNFLRECNGLLNEDDFKPIRRDGPTELWTAASVALDFYRRHREPVGSLLRPELIHFADKNMLGEKAKARLLDLAARLRDAQNGFAASAIVEKVISYKKDLLKARAVHELMDLSEAGELTDDKWLEVCMRGVEQFGQKQVKPVEFLDEIEDRIERREVAAAEGHRRNPFFLIDPLDELIGGIGRGHLGLWVAHLNVGKSFALEHTALAYLLQGMQVLYITLEDMLPDVEDRFDASIAELPIRRLGELPNKLRNRFQLFKNVLRSRLRVYDGTENQISVAGVEDLWQQEYNRGFLADAIFIDYDDEIRAPRKQQERRFEFADIYRELRRLAARRDVVVWTAAQTNRAARLKKIVTEGDLAEDVSKARKATLAIGIGRGEWGPDSRYLWVMRHKLDQKHVGCHVIGDFERGLFYKREPTLERMAAEAERREKEREKQDQETTPSE